MERVFFLSKAAIKFNLNKNNVFAFNFLQDHIVGKQNDMRTKIGQSNREEEQFVQEMLIKRRLFFSPFFSPTFFTFNRRQPERSLTALTKKTYNDNLESYILHQRMEISQLST